MHARSWFRRWWAGWTAAALWLVAGSAGAEVYYIDYEGGADTNVGLSTDAPWQRCPGMPGFSGAYQHAEGDEFVFRGGVTWPAASLPLRIEESGSAAASDQYRADASWFAGPVPSPPVFDLEKQTHRAVQVTNQHHVVLRGIQAIRPAHGDPYDGGSGVVFLRGVEHMRIEDCVVDASDGVGDSTALALHDVAHVQVRGNYLRARQQDINPDVIVLTPSSSMGRMEDVVISDNELTHPDNLGGDGIHVDCWSADTFDPTRPQGNLTHAGPIVIENNDFHDFAGRKFAVILLGGVKQATLRGNVFHGQQETGGSVRISNTGGQYYRDESGQLQTYWYEEVLIYNNVFHNQWADTWENFGGGVSIDAVTTVPESKLMIFNNSWYQDGTHPDWQMGIALLDNPGRWEIANNAFVGLTRSIHAKHPDDLANMVIDNNLFFDNDQDSATGTSPVLGDPQYQQSASGDLHLGAQSAAIDSGKDLSAHFGEDKEGRARPFGSGWDIGAYEYCGQDCGVAGGGSGTGGSAGSAMGGSAGSAMGGSAGSAMGGSAGSGGSDPGDSGSHVEQDSNAGCGCILGAQPRQPWSALLMSFGLFASSFRRRKLRSLAQG